MGGSLWFLVDPVGSQIGLVVRSGCTLCAHKLNDLKGEDDSVVAPGGLWWTLMALGFG